MQDIDFIVKNDYNPYLVFYYFLNRKNNSAMSAISSIVSIRDSTYSRRDKKLMLSCNKTIALLYNSLKETSGTS